MKLFFCLLLGLCLLLSGCGRALMGNDHEIPYETFDATLPQGMLREDPIKVELYNRAMRALTSAEYTLAWDLFVRLGNFRDAADYVSRFTRIPDTLMYTEYYVDGILIKTVPASYQSTENGPASLTDGILLSVEKPSGYACQETWLYDGYRLINSYFSDGTLARQERIPLQDADSAISSGYHVTFYYNQEGFLSQDNGYVYWRDYAAGSQSPALAFRGSYTYDDAGRLQAYVRKYQGDYAGTYTETFTYGDNNLPIRKQTYKQGDIFPSPFSDGQTLSIECRAETIDEEYRYDSLGRLIFLRQTITSAKDNETPTTLCSETEYRYAGDRLESERRTTGTDSPHTEEIRYHYGDYLIYLPEIYVPPVNDG